MATSADGGGEFVTALTGFDAAYRPTGTATVIPNTTKMAGLTGTYEQKVTYTADGQLASTTYPAAGGLRKETVATHYDDDTSVAEWMGGGFGWGTYVASSRTDVFGRLAYLDLGNTYGTVVSYGYETGTSRLQHVKLDRERIGGTELDLSYAYDDAGNVLSVKDRPTATGRAADRQCYQYDALRRLTEAWTPATGNCGLTRSIPALGGAAPYWTSFEYDALGNRTSEIYRTRGLAGDIDGGQTTTMDYSYAGTRDLNADGDATDVGEFAGPHAVTSITTDGPSGSTASTFTYDNAGRTLTQTQDSDYLTTKLSLGWDHETELASTSTATTVYPEPEPGSGDDDADGDQSTGTGPDRGTGTTTTVTGRNLYTADGDRIVRTAPDGSITVYLGGQEITKAANGSVTAARYYSFGGQTVAMRTANGLGGVTSLINDPHGTPLASVHNTNWTTTSVDKHYTMPFGEQRGDTSAPGDHEFLGKVRDEATGLTLVGARWYDETTGRFLTVDPVMDLTDPQQWNAYSYANNNPTTYWDPDGLEPRPWHQSGVGFSDSKSKDYLRSEGSNGDGWNTGWDRAAEVLAAGTVGIDAKKLNRLMSPRMAMPIHGTFPQIGQTSLYTIVDPMTGHVLKTGITSDPAGRYSMRRHYKYWNAEYKGNYVMQILDNYDSEDDARKVERYMQERFKGKEGDIDWGGKKPYKVESFEDYKGLFREARSNLMQSDPGKTPLSGSSAGSGNRISGRVGSVTNGAGGALVFLEVGLLAYQSWSNPCSLDAMGVSTGCAATVPPG